MPKADDPFYNRKPVPDELIEDVGLTGLTREEEFLNRERKFFLKGGDIRNFFNPPGTKKGTKDPYYQRKSVDKAQLVGVGETGLTPEQEYWNRERKYSVNGVDVRKFSKGTWEPPNDPYYSRKRTSKEEIHGVGEIDLTPAEVYEQRERKQSLVQFSGDPFQQLVGAGHRSSSISGAAAGASTAATVRRRSSAAPGGAAAAAAKAVANSGYAGPALAPIQSIAEASSENAADPASNNAAKASAPIEHYDDPDAVAPHEVR